MRPFIGTCILVAILLALGFLREVIGGRRIVQLGESGHGVADFNHAKVRLIKYLHEGSLVVGR